MAAIHGGVGWDIEVNVQYDGTVRAEADLIWRPDGFQGKLLKADYHGALLTGLLCMLRLLALLTN